jgi:hypothetical protein
MSPLNPVEMVLWLFQLYRTVLFNIGCGSRICARSGLSIPEGRGSTLPERPVVPVRHWRRPVAYSVEFMSCRIIRKSRVS